MDIDGSCDRLAAPAQRVSEIADWCTFIRDWLFLFPWYSYGRAANVSRRYSHPLQSPDAIPVTGVGTVCTSMCDFADD